MKPSWRGIPPKGPPRPTITLRSARSFMSTARPQVMRRWSSPVLFGRKRWLSSMAERSAWAEVIAWKSPVKWRLMSSIGTTWEWPPPAAPPLIPKTGPSDASRMHRTGLRSRRLSASARPTEVVDLPSPAAVGLHPVTSTSRAPRWGRPSITSRGTFALWWPYCRISSSPRPTFAAISAIGFISWACAISMSESMGVLDGGGGWGVGGWQEPRPKCGGRGSGVARVRRLVTFGPPPRGDVSRSSGPERPGDGRGLRGVGEREPRRGDGGRRGLQDAVAWLRWVGDCRGGAGAPRRWAVAWPRIPNRR